MIKFTLVEQRVEEGEFMTSCSRNPDLYIREHNELSTDERDERKRLCSECIVRLECTADAVNLLLDGGRKPSKMYSPGFMAGMTAGDQVKLAKTFYAKGMGEVTVGQIIEHNLGIAGQSQV